MNPYRPDPAVLALISQLKGPETAARKALHALAKKATIKDLDLIIRELPLILQPGFRSEVIDFLSSIRSAEAPAIFAGSLTDPDLVSVRSELTRACWESQLDFSPHLMLFCHLLITGDYTLAVEAFSVIENTYLEYPVGENLTREIFDLLTNSLPDQPDTKQRLLREMIRVIEPFATRG